VALRDVPLEEVSSYGVAKTIGEVEDGLVQVSGIAEKPKKEEAPSALAVASGYLLTPDILPIIEKEMIGPDGELRINDAYEELASQRDVYGLTIQGDYHDTGNPMAYLKTVIEVALKDDEIGPDLKEFLQHMFAK